MYIDTGYSVTVCKIEFSLMFVGPCVIVMTEERQKSCFSLQPGH